MNHSSPSNIHFQPNRATFIVLVATTILAIAISIFCLSSGSFIIFQNLFYIPIIIACLYYAKRGFVFSVVIAGIYFFLVILFTRESAILLQAFIRVLIFVLIAGLITYLSSMRKREEEVLFESEEKFKSVVDSSQDCIKILDKNGKLLFLSKAGLKEHGFKAPEEALNNWDYLATIEEEFMPKIKEALNQALEGATTSFDVKHKQEANIVGRSDREWCNMTFSPLKDKKGEILNILAISRDISERIKAKEELEKEKESVERKVTERTRELKEEQARLMASIDSLTIGFILCDFNDKIVLKNKAVGRILEIPENEITVDRIKKYFEGVADLKTFHDQCLKEKKPAEIKNVGVGKKFFRLLLAPVVMLRDSEEVIGHILLIEDITEEKVIERSREEFFAVASHELRTPLTAIRGNTSLIKDFYADKIKDKKIMAIISDIHEASVRLIEIVHDFLDISAMEQHKIEFKKEQFDIIVLIQEIIRDLKEGAATKKLYLNLEKLEITLPMIIADRDRTKQILFNLISNGVNYTQKGGVSIKVEKQDKFLKVYVSDTGIGILPENQTLLFRKFQQAGEKILTRDVTKGTGLGLYISKLLAEGMAGTIELVKSQPGAGSTFAFTLPIAPQFL